MTAKEMKSLKPEDTVVYDDGRAGHRGVKAVVLSNHPDYAVVQFEDRADTTTMRHSDTGWTEYLSRA